MIEIKMDLYFEVPKAPLSILAIAFEESNSI